MGPRRAQQLGCMRFSLWVPQITLPGSGTGQVLASGECPLSGVSEQMHVATHKFCALLRYFQNTL